MGIENNWSGKIWLLFEFWVIMASLFQRLKRMYGPTFIHNIQWQKAKEGIYNKMLMSSIILWFFWSLMYIDEFRNTPWV